MFLLSKLKQRWNAGHNKKAFDPISEMSELGGTVHFRVALGRMPS